MTTSTLRLAGANSDFRSPLRSVPVQLFVIIASWVLMATVRALDPTATNTTPISSSLPSVKPQIPNRDLAEDDDSVDSRREVFLTPWWGLRFAVGETAEIDCGFFTDGHTENFETNWIGPRGPISADNSRLNLTNKKSAFDAYSVLTLRIDDLSDQDSGRYICNVTDKTDNTFYSRNITLDVITKQNKAEYVCGFEGGDLCGWTVDGSTGISWHKHGGDEPEVINRKKGPRFDHTYGSSKHTGHFMDTDLHEEPNRENTTLTARLVSPVFEKHDNAKCLEFWYMFEGQDQEHLKVTWQPVNNEKTKDILVLDSKKELEKTKDWQRANVTISSPGKDYRISIESSTCSGSCQNAAAGLDDIRIRNGDCSDVTDDWSESSIPVRLVNGSTSYEGRLEILHDGEWGTVCSTGYGVKESKIVCETLGFGIENLKKLRDNPFGSGKENMRIWLHSLDCEHKDRDLGSCLAQHEMWGEVGECTHADDVAVRCGAPATPAEVPPAPQDKLSSTTVPTTSTTSIVPAVKSETAAVSSTPTPTEIERSSIGSTAKPQPGGSVASTEQPKSSLAPTPAPASSRTSTSVNTKPTPSPTATVTSSTEKASTKSTVTSPTKPVTTPASKATPSKPSPPPAKPTEKKAGVGASTDMPDLVSGASGAGVAVGIIVAVFIAAAVIGVLLYRRRKTGRKNAYITFGNPSYSKEHLPANDFSLESPLTLSSNGYTVLA